MSSRGSVYGARERTQRDKMNDALLFIYNARPASLLAMTADRLCADKGVSNRDMRREIGAQLEKMQARERQDA